MSLPVEVAHLEFGVVCTAHAELLADTRPDADALKQPVPVARKRFEVEAVVAKRVVVVALVVVERVAVKKPRVPTPRLKFVANRFVELAVVAKKLVVVALVPVAFREKMKSVVEATPLSVTWKSVVEALSVISKTRAPVAVVDAQVESLLYTVEVPIAVFPNEVRRMRSVLLVPKMRSFGEKVPIARSRAVPPFALFKIKSAVLRLCPKRLVPLLFTPGTMNARY
jgi:hypothetical protein